MAYAEQTKGFSAPHSESSAALSYEWRRLTRAATFVAVLTAPAFFLVLHDSNHLSVGWSLALAALGALLFRGLVEVIVRRFIPWPSLLGASAEIKEQDITARRRYWYWRSKFKWLPVWVIAILIVTQISVSSSALSGIALLFVQLPLLLFFNAFILFGPFLMLAVRSIRSYEPGDASWGVKLDDVRGQADSKQEISRVITLWQSGEEFEQAGGKRERGLLFLGAPGTGKTMISKAIATNFNCPFVTIPGSGFAQMFMGMDAMVVQLLAHKARKLARKWGGQCIVFIDEIDAVGMRRSALGAGAALGPYGDRPSTIHDHLFFGPNGSITPDGDLIIETRQWREQLFAQRAAAETAATGGGFLRGVASRVNAVMPGGMMGGYQGQALNQLLVVMDGMGEPPVMRKFFINRFNTFLDAMFVIPSRIGKLKLRLPAPKPRKEEIYFIGACNVPLESLDPALTRPGRMGRHIHFRTPDKDDRKDIFELYMAKVDHEPDLDTDRRRDELARITPGYSPSMIEQCCSMALTIAHSEGRKQFAWRDLVEAMTTVETGTAQNVEYLPEESRSTAIHEAGHAAAGHVYLDESRMSTRLSIRKRGSSMGHYMSLAKEERFIEFRANVFGDLIMTLGAMAAEHVFYGENSQGVGGDLFSATATASLMVGQWGMGPDELPLTLKPTRRLKPGEQPDPKVQVRDRLEEMGNQIMNRASGSAVMGAGTIGNVVGTPGKRAAVAQLLGQAYVTAYALMAANKDALNRIADVLIERKEMHGDEVVDLLDSVGLVRPEIDLNDDSTWPTV